MKAMAESGRRLGWTIYLLKTLDVVKDYFLRGEQLKELTDLVISRAKSSQPRPMDMADCARKIVEYSKLNMLNVDWFLDLNIVLAMAEAEDINALCVSPTAEKDEIA